MAIALALLACALLPSAARADEMVFEGVNGVAYGGFYVSPYSAADTTLGTTIQLYCLDFNHDVNFGQQWTAHIQDLSAANVGSYQYGANNTTFVTAPGLGLFERYEAAAWLFSQEGSAPTARVLGIYEYAAWALFLDTAHESQYENALNSVNDTDPVTHNTFQFDVQQALNAALDPANYGTVNLANWQVVTPDPAGLASSVQEFLTPTPEPSATIFTGATLIGLALLWRRRLNRIS
jgi:hypothetical protein